jgi:hypothetical protein
MRPFFQRTSTVILAAALLVSLACSRPEQPSSTAETKPAAAPTSATAPAPAAAPAASAPAAPAGWKTVANDSKTCRLSLPPNWSDQGMGMFGGPKGQEMVMFIEDEQTQKAGNWNPVQAEIARKKATGAKVEVLEESPSAITFQAPQGSVLTMMAVRRSPKTLCVAQIGVPAGDPAEQKMARQIAGSLTPAP